MPAGEHHSTRPKAAALFPELLLSPSNAASVFWILLLSCGGQAGMAVHRILAKGIVPATERSRVACIKADLKGRHAWAIAKTSQPVNCSGLLR